MCPDGLQREMLDEDDAPVLAPDANTTAPEDGASSAG
jgi:hypothetical protein